ncbi:MAG: helix-turn-helix transcriptional regulator [Prevotella sp.]|nr:helix-turn-helix transcriptional regulator [Prevotella sp.]
MKNQKMYEADDKMISLIRDNYDLLQSLGSFGISLGFGDKTVQETCEDNNVDTYTFLAVVNFAMNGYGEFETDEKISVPTLLHYLEASHAYFLDFQLPYIRRELTESLNENDIPDVSSPTRSLSLARLILRFYDEYAREIRLHMKYEQKTLFPYVESLLKGRPTNDYNVETFSKHHGATDKKLRELKLLIIKYLPQDGLHNNQLTATLHDIYENEVWLRQHAEVEDHIFVPAIRRLEQKVKQSDVTKNISDMVFKGSLGQDSEALSDREKDVIVSLVQGMSNKEIADHLCISTNTVITHRRNIARKLQIHSPAGLTIYAIVNGLVDISAVKI